MNPYSGRTYRLGEDLLGEAPYGGAVTVGHVTRPAQLATAAKDIERELTEDERAALEDPGPLVLVSEEVARQMALGGRELDRRKRRRKAARESRRRNR